MQIRADGTIGIGTTNRGAKLQAALYLGVPGAMIIQK